MAKYSKLRKVIGLVVILISIGCVFQYVGGAFSVWDSDSRVPQPIFVIWPIVFVVAIILIMGSGQDGEKHLFRGCAVGALFLMALIAVVFLSVMLDMGSWGGA